MPHSGSYECLHDAIIATAVGINADAALRYHSSSAIVPL